MEKRTVTDVTTREELLDYIYDLENEIEALELVPQQLERLEEAAEWAVERGVIHNTPSAKYRWIAGK